MPLSVDVVIPVHGQWELTERCLESLGARDSSIRRIIVVDDKSPDDSAERLRERSDIVPLILETNVGFARACNAGARAGDADAIFFLNNDTLVAPGTIDRLAATLEESGAGAVGPKLLHGDGTLQVAGIAMLARQTHFERLFVYLDADLPQAQIAYEPIALSGAAVLVRRDAFVAVGEFEEAFLNGSEDVDLSLKLWAAGYHCRYEPRASIVHLEGASRGKLLDNAPNDVLLRSRWADRCDAVPRFIEPLPPLLDLRWTSATPLERAAKACFRATLAVHAGARVMENQPGLARAMAALDRRERLTISHRGAASVHADVVWCAPDSVGDAMSVRARNPKQFWVPSEHCRTLLREAGAAAESIAVVRPGYPVPARATPRDVTSAIVVCCADTAAAKIDPLIAALDGLPVERVIAENADTATVARIANAPLRDLRRFGRRVGLLGTAALAGGALVIAFAGSPFLEIMPPEACVIVDETELAADAIRAIRSEPAAFVARGPRAAREMSRRSPDLHAGRRIRELARELIHGAVDPLTLTITGAIAATMRGPNVA